METNETTGRKRSVWTILTVLVSIVILLQLALLFQRQVMLRRSGSPDSSSPVLTAGQRIRSLLPWSRKTTPAPSSVSVTPDTVWDHSSRMARMHSRINRMFQEALDDNFRFPLAPAVASSPPTSNGSAPPDPLRRMHDMHREIDALFQEALHDSAWRHAGFDDGWADLAVTPGMTVKDNGENYELRVALPDVDKADIQLSLEGSVLTLKVEQNRTTASEQTSPSRASSHSRRISRFEQRIRLPGADPDPNHVKASLEQGVLRIVVPKRSGNEYEQGAIKVI